MIRSRVRVLVSICAAIVLAALALSGCSSQRDDSAKLTDHLWQAREVRVEDRLAPVPDSGGPTTEFAVMKVIGTTGVNRYSGQYSTETGNKITITIGPMTLMAGPPEAVVIEQSFIDSMKSATRYTVSDTELQLQDDAGNVLVSYTAIEGTPLVGTDWKCTMYNNGRGGFQSVIPTSTITAAFSDDEKLTGNAGVNTYNGSYTADSGKMTINPAISATMMAGPEDLMAQEQAYLQALPKAATYKIEGSRLMLRDATDAAIAEYTAK